MKHNLNHNLRLPLFLALALGVTSCSSWLLSDTAIDTFQTEKSCPKDRIKISFIAVQPQDVFETPTPPAEVAADPGRLKVWTRKINDDFKNYENLTFFDAAGCGAHVTYSCWLESNGDQSSSACYPVNLDNPRARVGAFRLKASAGQALKERLQVRN